MCVSCFLLLLGDTWRKKQKGGKMNVFSCFKPEGCQCVYIEIFVIKNVKEEEDDGSLGLENE